MRLEFSWDSKANTLDAAQAAAALSMACAGEVTDCEAWRWDNTADTNFIEDKGSFWVNYNELTTSSLEIMVNKGNHPQMALIQVSELL